MVKSTLALALAHALAHSMVLVSCFIGALLSPMALADKPPPSIELLEYLADMNDNDGEWIDPLKMKELANNMIDEPEKKEKGNE